MIDSSLRFVFGCALGLASVACGPSPQPLPPPIDIVVQGITIRDAGGGQILVSGTAGTAVSAALVDVANTGSVSGNFVAATLTVADDGSFGGQLAGTVEDALRVQATSADDRSVTRDILDPGTGATEAFRVPCLVIEEGEEVDFGVASVGGPLAAFQVILANNCTTITSVDESVLLDPVGWEQDLDGAVPLDMLPGATEDNNMGFVAQDVGPALNYLRLLIIGSDNQPEYRLLTLRGEGQ